jgi:hypothetical protein
MFRVVQRLRTTTVLFCGALLLANCIALQVTRRRCPKPGRHTYAAHAVLLRNAHHRIPTAEAFFISTSSGRVWRNGKTEVTEFESAAALAQQCCVGHTPDPSQAEQQLR